MPNETGTVTAVTSVTEISENNAVSSTEAAQTEVTVDTDAEFISQFASEFVSEYASEYVGGIIAEQIGETEEAETEHTVTEATTAHTSATTAQTTAKVSETEAVTSITLLEEEIPEVNTETTTAVVLSPVPAKKQFEIEQYIPYILFVLIFLLAFASIALYLKAQKKRKEEKSARRRDKERLAEVNASKKSKKEKKKGIFYGLTHWFYLPKTVRDTIPYKKVLDNDIWLISDKKYSKVYKVEDINYNLGDENQQEDILESYCNYLNTLDETIVCQVTVWNNQINIEEHERAILIKNANDKYNYIRKEYNDRVLKAGLSRGQNAIKKSIYITMTIECPDEETAKRKFNSIDLTIKNSFDHIGNTALRPVSNQERVELLKNFFIGTDYKIPVFSKEEFAKGLEKTYIAPEYFEFKSDYFLFGDYYASCVFIKDYPNTVTDNVLTELMNTNLELIVTSNILAYDSAKARTMVQHQISNVNADMGQREAKAAKQGYFSATMPVKVRNMVDSYKELFDMITIHDERLFLVNTVIMIKTKTHEELINALELIDSTLKRQGCLYGKMKFQQEDGMADCLPIGSQRRFKWNRSLPTESVGIFIPFNVKEVQQENAIYYGLNKLSNNMITFHRILSLINPSGYILGTSGSGKSFAAKREMVEVYMRFPDAEIIIIDPEREYPAITGMFQGQVIKVSTGSQTYINPFDFDINLIDDDEYDIIKEKSGLITSFISCMYTNRDLTPQEISFIDRCVRITYKNSGFFESLDKKDMPILEDFYHVIEGETENVDEKMKRDMLATLEMYVGEGSANYFNHHTNVDIYNRLVSFDIKDLTGVLKTQAMLLVLDNMWNRLSANRERGIPTWIYCDEIHVLFADDYCRNFFQSLYKRARKYGGVLTGITQNITDLLHNEACCTMLANSEFLLLLKQSASDSLKLQEVLHFTNSELFYVNNIAKGEGLLVLGGKDKIPFYDRFPTDTQLYRYMSTSFSETQEMMQK